MKDKIILILCSLAVGMIIASAYWSQKQTPAPAIQYRDKIVEHVVEKRDVVTKIVKDKDGTITTVITDKTVVNDNKTVEHKSETKPNIPAQYDIGVNVRVHPSNLLVREYEVTVGRRLFGPAWIELGLSTDKTVTLGGRFEF